MNAMMNEPYVERGLATGKLIFHEVSAEWKKAWGNVSAE